MGERGRFTSCSKIDKPARMSQHAHWLYLKKVVKRNKRDDYSLSLLGAGGGAARSPRGGGGG